MGSFSKAFFSIGVTAAAVFSAIRGDHVVALLLLIFKEVTIIRSDMEDRIKGGQ